MGSNNREIDVFELYRRTLSFIKRRWLLILLIAVIGGGWGFVKEKIKGSSFQGKVIISSEIISKEDLYQKIYPLTGEEDRLDARYFADYLNADAQLFQGFSNFNVDTTALKHSLVISYWHTDSVKIKKIGRVLSDFYNNQPEIQSQYESEMKSIRRYLELIGEELDDINAFQENLLKSTGNSDVIVMNMAGSSEEILSLYGQQLKLERKLNLGQPVKVSFDDILLEKKASYIKSIVLWAFLFGILAFILALILELDREAGKRN